MNQNGDNNYYDHDQGKDSCQQPYPPVPPRYTPPAGGSDNRGSGNFLLGLLAGVLITAMVGGCTYVGVRVYLLTTGKAARITAGSGSTADSLVNDETIKKLGTLEEVIEEYYYKEEDINTDSMIEGLYSGLVDSLGDPY